MHTILFIRIISVTALVLASQLSAGGQTPFITRASDVITTHMELSTQRTTVVVFSAPIAENGVDRGSAQVLAKTVDGVGNVIKVKAASDSLLPTNLTIFTSDGRVYRFLVEYNASPRQDFYDFSGLPGQAASSGVRFLPDRMNEASIIRTSTHITELPAHRRRPTSKSNGDMKLRTKGIFLSEGVLFFHLSLANSSAIPYELDFIRCYQRDRKKSKRTSQMVKEVKTLATSFVGKPVIGAGDAGFSMVLAFEKFTISDSKYFMIELFEKKGDRHLVLKIKGDDILKAKPLLVSK
ncbi:conjugative transposon protein TraN [Pseudoflavitalea sp. X16]|uniref:conjugative transposon protein TraN n=1 Tax=Paraflavitalea devenefica TaxID=2716334 RepID=UPI001421B00C|nr:conjugative transposon protein TraN [Paraflavitalea devenefica]NII26165.1 conjugative transposon protein TraN [Paraflavitalea devenefica]